ncbi:TPA: hypothetical protein ENS27_00005 [bacterium]|nr:hypothetical protein [bacterium]
MFWVICWIIGFLGPIFLLFSVLFSRRKYKSLLGFELESSRTARSWFFFLLSILIFNTILFDRFLTKANVYYILSIITLMLGLISFVISFWVLSEAVGKRYAEYVNSIKKKDQSDEDIIKLE